MFYLLKHVKQQAEIRNLLDTGSISSPSAVLCLSRAIPCSSMQTKAPKKSVVQHHPLLYDQSRMSQSCESGKTTLSGGTARSRDNLQ